MQLFKKKKGYYKQPNSKVQCRFDKADMQKYSIYSRLVGGWVGGEGGSCNQPLYVLFLDNEEADNIIPDNMLW